MCTSEKNRRVSAMKLSSVKYHVRFDYLGDYDMRSSRLGSMHV